MLGFEKLALEVLVAVFVAAWVLGITYLTLRSFERYSGTFIVRRGTRRFSAQRRDERPPFQARGSLPRMSRGFEPRVGVSGRRAR
jgi:hypothetical protein